MTRSTASPHPARPPPPRRPAPQRPRPAPAAYDLVWRARVPPATARVGLHKQNAVVAPDPVPAVILFPAFLTPAVHVLEDGGGMIELLIAARGTPELTPEVVNQHLRVIRGLDPMKRAGWRPLFDPKDKDFKDRIVVEKAKDAAILETRSKLFRGILDKRFRAGLPAFLDAFYEVRIHESCLAPPPPPPPPKHLKPLPEPTRAVIELQDLLIEDVLRGMNGPDLGGAKEKPPALTWPERARWVSRLGKWAGKDDELPPGGGKGLHAFRQAGSRVDLSSIDPTAPIRAHHLLFVYEKGGLVHANLGHASDLHINARQQVLARSAARVVEMEDPNALADSPEIGGLFNDCGANFASILSQLGQRSDLALIGGDLIDHVRNVYPYSAGTQPGDLAKPSVAKIWELVNLKDKAAYQRNYQAFVDHITFYTIVLNHCRTQHKPVFVVSGNHDAYHEAFGITPRVVDQKLGYTKRANEGIPADTNLTFYEAILAFGKSYGEIVKSFNFDATLFAWFYAVFTPWSDFAVSLPSQRIVGLAWGDAEKMISGWTGHGFGHLPRADQAVTDDQLALFRDGLSAERRSVLFSHFTFVSYGEAIPNGDPKRSYDPAAAAPGSVKLETDFAHQKHDELAQQAVPPQGEKKDKWHVRLWRGVKAAPGAVVDGVKAVGSGISHGARSAWNAWKPYTDNDYGTFEKKRKELYQAVADAQKVQCVLTGHSHRKGLYFLEKPEGDGYRTLMYSLARPQAGLPLLQTHTPIVVSDSAGPVPRMNLHDEFLEWGSDRPAGTVVRIDDKGKVTRVEPVASQVAKAPRLAVALEYLHVMKDAVFDGIETSTFEARDRLKVDHVLYLRVKKAFKENVKLERVTLYGKASTEAKAPWFRVVLVPPATGATADGAYAVRVPPGERGAYLDWMALPDGAGRFMSLKFRIDDPVATAFDAKDPRYPAYNADDPWNFEVKVRGNRKVAASNALSDAARGMASVRSMGAVPPAPAGDRGEGYVVEPQFESPDFAWRQKFEKYRSASGKSGK
ncbi:MAG: metallophosphoesterase [Deltaproteobacteria bacterium]|nr:metallophosphoesterase [Deltaproteobacteria bacterium]